MTETSWSVRVEWYRGASPPTDAEIAEIAGALDCPITTNGEAKTMGAQLTVDAGTAQLAIELGLRTVRAAARAAGLRFDPILAEVIGVEYARQRAERPAIPPLVGRAECAEILGVTVTRAKQVADTDPDHPAPVQEFAGGPLYLRAHIEAYAVRRHRTSGPRPRT